MSDAVRPLLDTSGVIFADHDQFVIADEVTDTTDARAKGSLLEVGPGFLSTFTGVSYGPVRVTVRVFTSEPADEADNWEVVEESTLHATAPVAVRSLDGHAVADIDEVPAGHYRIRAHARGRDTATSLEVTEPVEDYLFHFWPAATSPDRVDVSVATILKTDRAWPTTPPAKHEPPTKTVPKPDFSYVYIRTADGEIEKVDRHGFEADDVREWKNEYGGRPLSPELKSTTYARYVAALDRDLLDRIATSSAEDQLRFARWCAHQAFEKSGLTGSSWLRDLLQKLDDGTFKMKDAAGAKQRLNDDPQISVCLVTGLPGEPETVQQHQALLALEVTQLEDFTPLKIAVWSYRHALQAFGMDYPEMLRSANHEFPPE